MNISMLPAAILLAAPLLCYAQGGPPSIIISQDAPPSGTCVDTVQVGNIIIRSNNTAALPVGVYRCSQILDSSVYGAGAFSWQPIGHFLGPNLPAKCALGEIAFRTAAAAGQNIYGCTAPNVWTLQSGGGAGPVGATGDVQINGGLGVFGSATIPDCQNVGGQHLNYNRSIHEFVCGTSSSILSWGALTNSNWTALDNAQWAALGN